MYRLANFCHIVGRSRGACQINDSLGGDALGLDSARSCRMSPTGTRLKLIVGKGESSVLDGLFRSFRAALRF